jgi:hypothetical protein
MLSLMLFVALCVRYAAGLSYNPWWLLAAIVVDVIVLWFIGAFDTSKRS